MVHQPLKKNVRTRAPGKRSTRTDARRHTPQPATAGKSRKPVFRYREVLGTVMRTITRRVKTGGSRNAADLAAGVSQAFRDGQERINRLSSLIQVTSLVNSSLNETEVLNTILEHATQVTRAEASSIILKGEDGHSLYFLAATGKKAEEVKKLKLEIGEGIAGWVVSKGESVLSADVTADPRFSRRVSESVQFQSHSIACSPMRIRGRIIGAIEVINRQGGGTFDEDDLDILEAFANAAATALENARLYRLAITDELTGLYSHRYFKDYLNLELHKAKRLGRSMSVLLLDIDNFKTFNDTYGHAVGDEILRGVARVLRKGLRETDVIARYGGEEIGIILTELKPPQVRTIAQRLRSQIAEYRVRSNGNDIGVTVSIGASFFPGSADEPDSLFEKADQALYAAKAAGKNCVRSSDGG